MIASQRPLTTFMPTVRQLVLKMQTEVKLIIY